MVVGPPLHLMTVQLGPVGGDLRHFPEGGRLVEVIGTDKRGIRHPMGRRGPALGGAHGNARGRKSPRAEPQSPSHEYSGGSPHISCPLSLRCVVSPAESPRRRGRCRDPTPAGGGAAVGPLTSRFSRGKTATG